MQSTLYLCAKCGESKPITEFYIRQSGPRCGQIKRPCKCCTNRLGCIYNKTQKNRIYQLRYRQSDEYKRSLRERKKRYNKTVKGREAIARYNATENARDAKIKYRNTEKGKTYQKSYDRRYYQTEKGREVIYRKVAKRRILAPSKLDLTEKQWQVILHNFMNSCAYCGRSDTPLEQDHILPLSKGGQHTSENIAPSCASCNRKKQATIPFGCLHLCGKSTKSPTL